MNQSKVNVNDEEINGLTSQLLLSKNDQVFGIKYTISSDDGFCPESKTDTGHKCGTYMWFDALYIGKVDRCWHLRSDNRSMSDNEDDPQITGPREKIGNLTASNLPKTEEPVLL